MSRAFKSHSLDAQGWASLVGRLPQPQSKESTMIKPTVGRVVLYYTNGKTQFDANEQPEAATVAYVHSDTMVNLSVVDHNGVQYGVRRVFLYQGEGERPLLSYAEWMPYQKQVAAGAIAPTLHATA
jgi:hypothetical protein